MGMFVKNSHRRILYNQYSAIRGESQLQNCRFAKLLLNRWVAVGNSGSHRFLFAIQAQVRPFHDDDHQANDTTDPAADDGKWHPE
jgi:hypothetical protein